MAKILFSEITALSNDKGYCWASNEYFASAYDVSTRQVSAWISDLANCGYITRTIIYHDNSKEIKERRLYPCEQTLNCEELPAEEKNNGGMEEKFYTPQMPENECNTVKEPETGENKENFHTLMKKTSTGMEEKFSTPIEENFDSLTKKSSGGIEENFQDNIKFKLLNINNEEEENKLKNEDVLFNYFFKKYHLRFDSIAINIFLSFMHEKKLDYKKYIDFVVDFSKKQTPQNLRNYFYKIFCDHKVLDIYQKTVQYETIELKKHLHICISCGNEYDSRNENCCPVCFLSEAEKDTEIIRFHQDIAALPLQERLAAVKLRTDVITENLRKKFLTGTQNGA